jgi:hypothetical protein
VPLDVGPCRPTCLVVDHLLAYAHMVALEAFPHGRFDLSVSCLRGLPALLSYALSFLRGNRLSSYPVSSSFPSSYSSCLYLSLRRDRGHGIWSDLHSPCPNHLLARIESHPSHYVRRHPVLASDTALAGPFGTYSSSYMYTHRERGRLRSTLALMVRPSCWPIAVY